MTHRKTPDARVRGFVMSQHHTAGVVFLQDFLECIQKILDVNGFGIDTVSENIHCPVGDGEIRTALAQTRKAG